MDTVSDVAKDIVVNVMIVMWQLRDVIWFSDIERGRNLGFENGVRSWTIDFLNAEGESSGC